MSDKPKLIAYTKASRSVPAELTTKFDVTVYNPEFFKVVPARGSYDYFYVDDYNEDIIRAAFVAEFPYIREYELGDSIEGDLDWNDKHEVLEEFDELVESGGGTGVSSELIEKIDYVYAKSGKQISISSFGAVEGSINSQEIYVNAMNAASLAGASLYIDGRYNFDGATVVHDKYVSVIGFGALLNLNINVDLLEDDSLKISFRDFLYRSDDGTDSINITAAKGLEIASVTFVNSDHPITSTSTSFHSVSLLNVHNCKFFGCDAPIYFNTTIPTNRPFSDLMFTDNRLWFNKIYGLYANQLDGLTYSDNLSHFDDNVSTSKNHIYINKGEQIVIGAGNTFFNSGEEGILMEDTTSCQIGGSQRFWHNGQNVTSSAIKFNNDSSHFLNLTIDGALHFEKPSLHMIEVQAPQGIVKVGEISGVVDVRVAYNETTNPQGHYYGPDDLSSITHYGIYAPLGCEVISEQKNLKFINSGGKLLNIGSSYPLIESYTYMGERNVKGSTSIPLTFSTNAPQRVCRVFDSLQTSGNGSGELEICVYGSSGLRAVYKFLVSIDGTSGAYLESIGSTGRLLGASALEPSFTFAMGTNGDINATRVNTTVSGTFDFVVHGQGDLYPRNLS